MNLKFQMAAVNFWLSHAGEIEHARSNAYAKSWALLDAAEKLFSAFRKENESRF